MRIVDAAIPLGAVWSSPFVRWQGSLAEINSIDLATQVTSDALARAGVDANALTDVVLGMTVPQHASFYAAPTLAARIGAPGVSGPTIAQACATSVACVQAGATIIEGSDSAVLLVTTDRISNSPLIVYPSPSSPGGTPEVERWTPLRVTPGRARRWLTPPRQSPRKRESTARRSMSSR